MSITRDDLEGQLVLLESEIDVIEYQPLNKIEETIKKAENKLNKLQSLEIKPDKKEEKEEEYEEENEDKPTFDSLLNKLSLLKLKYASVEVKRDENSKILGEKSKVAELALERTRRSDEPLLKILKKIIPDPKENGIAGAVNQSVSSRKALSTTQIAEIKNDISTLNAYFIKYQKEGVPLNILIKLKEALNQTAEYDEKNFEKLEARKDRLNEENIAIYTILYNTVPYYFIDPDKLNSNNLTDIIDHYMHVFLMHNSNSTEAIRKQKSYHLPLIQAKNSILQEGSLSWYKENNEGFKIFSKKHTLEDKVSNREFNYDFHYFRIELRKLINTFEVDKTLQSPLFQSVSPRTEVSDVDQPLSTFAQPFSFSDLAIRSSAQQELVRVSSPLMRKDKEMTSDEKKSMLVDLNASLKEHENKASLLYDIEVKTFKSYEQQTLKDIAAELKYTPPSTFSKKTEPVEKDFYSKVLKDYKADETKDKTLRKHWDKALSETAENFDSKVFKRLEERVVHPGPYPTPRHQSLLMPDEKGTIRLIEAKLYEFKQNHLYKRKGIFTYGKSLKRKRAEANFYRKLLALHYSNPDKRLKDHWDKLNPSEIDSGKFINHINHRVHFPHFYLEQERTILKSQEKNNYATKNPS